VVDLSHNKIEDPEAMEVFKSMPGLRVLNLMGNPVIRKTTQYRKTMINEIKQLTYLDDRPVFPKERACAEAFMIGGREAEREARTKFMDAERERQAQGIRHLMELQAQGREQARLGLDGADADRTDSEAENDTDDDDNDETTAEDEGGYESWQTGSSGNMHQNMPNIMDQMSGNIPTDNSNWQPDPALADVEVEADEPKIMELEELEALDTITGPKAADIDLFDSEDEFEVLDEDFMNHANDGASGGAAEPMMTVSSTTRTTHNNNNNNNNNNGPAANASGGGRTKMLIEEVKASPTAKAASGGSGKKTKLIIEEASSKSESDDDEIPEEISVRKSKKKAWFGSNDMSAGVDAPAVGSSSGGGAAVAVAAAAAAVADENDNGDDDSDDGPPALEEVDIETGVVTNLITEAASSSATSSPPPSSSSSSFSSSSTSRPMIEVIGGDDVDGLD